VDILALRADIVPLSSSALPLLCCCFPFCPPLHASLAPLSDALLACLEKDILWEGSCFACPAFLCFSLYWNAVSHLPSLQTALVPAHAFWNCHVSGWVTLRVAHYILLLLPLKLTGLSSSTRHRRGCSRLYCMPCSGRRLISERTGAGWRRGQRADGRGWAAGLVTGAARQWCSRLSRGCVAQLGICARHITWAFLARSEKLAERENGWQ